MQSGSPTDTSLTVSTIYHPHLHHPLIPENYSNHPKIKINEKEHNTLGGTQIDDGRRMAVARVCS